MRTTLPNGKWRKRLKIKALPPFAELHKVKAGNYKIFIKKLNENYQPDFILELDWETFFRHKHWHSRVGAYNLVITNSVIKDGKMVYKRDLN